ncbi:MAG: tRNA (adenosine(37)-N6)-dimethylallyltransferase MiaA [Gammaproteobacteria bacterium]|nr:tRNA (adenosine(37)-N6)-dimethylallyltransferase MiaA [Gammaproteobacteria bacterium]
MKLARPTIICLMGPTAVGKTSLAIALTERLPCEIISVDSGMIYRGMDIGTAKPTKAELAIAPHRLIDICDPAEIYSAGRFRNDALREIEEIIAKEHAPLLVGGTMLYFKVLIDGIAELPIRDDTVREKILAEAKSLGWNTLHYKLQKIDAVLAERISVSDSQRIGRALEVYELTGKSILELQKENSKPKIPYKIFNIAITPDSKIRLNEKINLRFNNMLECGFIEEVEKLFKRKDLNADLPSMRAIGYRQVWKYLSGEINYQDLLDEIPIATRQLAKRQLTWLRSWVDVNWFDCDSENLIEKVLEKLKIANFL